MWKEHSKLALKNIPEESSKKTITDIHRQISKETNDMVNDSTYKRPRHGHEDETESEDKVLMKRIKKMKKHQNIAQNNFNWDQRNVLKLKLKKRRGLSKYIQVL